MMEVNKKAITVTMDMETYDYLQDAVQGRLLLRQMLERANRDGEAIMTDELKDFIEDFYL